MMKIVAMGASSLIGFALLGMQPPDPEGPPGPPPPPAPPKKKMDGGPGGSLRQAYELLRRLRADGRSAGRSEERLRDWTDRAGKIYREGVKAFESKDFRKAHEYGLAAHDLARAVEHSGNASAYEVRDSDLPPPPGGGPEGNAGRVREDLWRVHDRLREGLGARDDAESRFYFDAARDLYRAARKDAEAGRDERAGELARAADAIARASDHLASAMRDAGDEPPPPDAEDQPKGFFRKKAAPRPRQPTPPPPPDGPDDAPDPLAPRPPAAPAPPLPPPPPLGANGREEAAEPRSPGRPAAPAPPLPPPPPPSANGRPEPKDEADHPKRPRRERGNRPDTKKEQRRSTLPPDL